MALIEHFDWSVNTHGIIPFICEQWEGKPLFIIKGGIRGHMITTVYGKAYFYEDFPWTEENFPKPSKEACLNTATRNNESNPHAWVITELSNQFRAMTLKMDS